MYVTRCCLAPRDDEIENVTFLVYWLVDVLDTVKRLEKFSSNISPKLLELETSNLVHGFVWRMTSRRTKIPLKVGVA